MNIFIQVFTWMYEFMYSHENYLDTCLHDKVFINSRILTIRVLFYFTEVFTVYIFHAYVYIHGKMQDVYSKTSNHVSSVDPDAYLSDLFWGSRHGEESILLHA